MFNLLKNNYLLFVGVILFILTLVIIIILTVSLSSERAANTPQQLITTPTPTPRFQRRQNDLPEAESQTYYSDNSGKVGTLIVTSSLKDVRVRIDDGNEESGINSTPYPMQYPPFIISNIPTGKHTLRAAKPGYVFQTIPVIINADKTTEIYIQLKPIRGMQDE